MVKYLKVIIISYSMTKKDTFLLLSLEDDKAKKLANVISSDVCRKLLDHLAKKESTESELSKELSIPISTVHYNLKQLVDAGLVKNDEFHYSEKGKEVNHYSLVNKYIIIAPKNTENIAAKIKRIIPAFLAVAVTGAIVQIFSNINKAAYPESGTIRTAEPMLSKGIADMAMSQEVNRSAANIVQNTINEPSIALWFVTGALFALIVYLIYDVAKERFK